MEVVIALPTVGGDIRLPPERPGIDRFDVPFEGGIVAGVATDGELRVGDRESRSAQFVTAKGDRG